MSKAGSSLGVIGLVVALGLLSGCATYSDKLLAAQNEAGAGAYADAIENVNRLLGVRSSEEEPDSWKGDRPLAALERSILLQATGNFEQSARDMGEADTEFGVLVLEGDVVGKVGKYLYSDSSGSYRASPTERIALNGLNMANYLAEGDLSGAAVEARRYTNLRDHLRGADLEPSAAFGSYLAGFVFERLGQGSRALRYYEEALADGPLESLVEPVVRLAHAHSYRGPKIDELLEKVRVSNDGAIAPQEMSAGPPSEILTFFALGRVPYKIPKRIPIGAAVGLAGSWVTGDSGILERSIFKVVVYPELTPSGTLARQATLTIDDRSVLVDGVTDLGEDVKKEYARRKPQILGAAISRLITRATAAEAARLAGQQAGGAGAIVGLLGALVTEGSLVALDKPDTRSWTFLSDQIAIARTPVAPGNHSVKVHVPGVNETRSISVNVPKEGFAVVLVTVPR